MPAIKARYQKYCDRLRELYNSWAERRYLSLPSELENLTYVEETSEFGRAVFATSTIPAGTLLGIYPGHKRRPSEFVAKDEFIDRSMRYSYYLEDGIVIDPTDLFGYVANKSHLRLALVNEPPVGTPVNVLPVNSSEHIWYVALSEIQKGEQLFTSYGRNYQRNYPSEMATTSGEVFLTKEEKEMLQLVGKRYPWLQLASYLATLINRKAYLRSV